MPNHITTRIKATDSIAFDVLKTVMVNEEGKVDLGRVIPEPPFINDEDHSVFNPHRFSWYYWRPKHWGTKWNAYHCKIDDEAHEIKFQTAWSHPRPVLEEVAALIPEYTYRVVWADEDWGRNLGCAVMGGGYLENHMTDEDDDCALSQQELENFAAHVIEGMPLIELISEDDDYSVTHEDYARQIDVFSEYFDV